MSENNSGAVVPQSDNRGNENKDKRQRFDPAKQDGRKNNYNRNRRRRNNGPRQGGYDNKKGENSEGQAEAKGQNRERNFDRQNNRDKNNNNNKQFSKREQREPREPREPREQNQNSEKRQQFSGERKPKNKRSRELDAEVAKNVKKVETIEDIRSDNARITKEIYLEIASLKNINLN